MTNVYREVQLHLAELTIGQLKYVGEVDTGWSIDDRATIVIDTLRRPTFSNLAELFGLIVEHCGDQDQATVEIGSDCVVFSGIEIKPKVTVEVFGHGV